jgi:hypothetical protein
MRIGLRIVIWLSFFFVFGAVDWGGRVFLVFLGGEGRWGSGVDTGLF